MTSPIEHLAGLVIGTVEAVAPNEVRVLLEAAAPQTTSFNTGTPVSFPRLNGYVLIPNEAGATVGFIAWMGTERAAFISGRGHSELGLVDLPFPHRRMVINPIGTLVSRRANDSDNTTLMLERGVVAFPSVGDQVLIPTPTQVAAIVGAHDESRRVQIGTSPMAADAPIMVDPDKLFGRHLAVLGNTGSGKSCSVAGLIRWSLEAAGKARKSTGTDDPPNARFIVLDPNGEYKKAFQDMEGVRVFRPGDGDSPLQIPAWLWNSHEWAAVSHAQPGTQRPLLNQALRNLRAGRAAREAVETKVARQLNLYLTKINVFLTDGSGATYSGFPGNMRAGETLVALSNAMRELAENVIPAGQAQDAVTAISNAAQELASLEHEPSGCRQIPGRATNAPCADEASFSRGTAGMVRSWAVLASEKAAKLLGTYRADGCVSGSGRGHCLRFPLSAYRTVVAVVPTRMAISFTDRPSTLYCWMRALRSSDTGLFNILGCHPLSMYHTIDESYYINFKSPERMKEIESISAMTTAYLEMVKANEPFHDVLTDLASEFLGRGGEAMGQFFTPRDLALLTAQLALNGQLPKLWQKVAAGELVGPRPCCRQRALRSSFARGAHERGARHPQGGT